MKKPIKLLECSLCCHEYDLNCSIYDSSKTTRLPVSYEVCLLYTMCCEFLKQQQANEAEEHCRVTIHCPSCCKPKAFNVVDPSINRALYEALAFIMEKLPKGEELEEEEEEDDDDDDEDIFVDALEHIVDIPIGKVATNDKTHNSSINTEQCGDAPGQTSGLICEKEEKNEENIIEQEPDNSSLRNEEDIDEQEPNNSSLQRVFSKLRTSLQRGPIITMDDTGQQVRMGAKIAQGGFSFVYEAFDENHKPYALKQIRCPDPNMLEECCHEAAVHRAVGHPNILPLLGFTVVPHHPQTAYMLFPRMNRSLRDEINRRILDANPRDLYMSTQPPWNEGELIQLFLGLARGLQAIHDAHYSHRDCKVENVMFEHSGSIQTPVWIDFGSAGPLKEEITTRLQVLTIVDSATQHTTMPYRPPELLEGGIPNRRCCVDFRKVDVWSLACTFFACLYGASPAESAFVGDHGRLRIVPCSRLKILGGIPKLPEHCAAASWYSKDILNLIEQMLVQDRQRRPSLSQVLSQLETLMECWI